MGLYRVLKIIALILGLLGAAALANLLFKGDDIVKATGEGLNLFLNIGYVTFIVTIVLVLIFVLRDLFTSDGIKSTLIGVGLLVLVGVVSYGIAGGEAITMSDGTALSESGSRWISAGLNAFYILGLGAIAVMLISEVKNLTISK